MLMLARVAQANALSRGRDWVVPEDVRAMAVDVLAHRMIVSGDESGHGYVHAVLEQVRLA